jgi:hypothetical protein
MDEDPPPEAAVVKKKRGRPKGSTNSLKCRTCWNRPAASREKHVGRIYGLASRVRPSRLPRPQGTGSYGPLRCREPPRFVPAPRWRLRVREEPPVAPRDSSGAIGGVLELPGDDYFIYGPAEREVHRSALSTACVPVHEHAGHCLCRLRMNIK